MNRRIIALLSLGHFTVDVYSGAVPMLLFLLRPTLHLTYEMVGAASVVFTLTSSLIQPAFGYFSDRRQLGVLMPVGCLLCAAGLSVASVAVSYPLLLLFIVVSGLGSALYHPQATKMTAFFSGERRGSGMSLFSVGGNLGFAAGPGVLLLLLGHVRGVAPVALFACGLLMAGVLWRLAGRTNRATARREAAQEGPAEPVAWGPMIKIILVVALRSWVYTGLVYFLPYWVAHTGGGSAGGLYVSAFLFAGGLGTLVGGPLSDRWGRKTVLLLSLTPLTPLLLLFLALRGAPALAVVTVAGFLLIASFSLTVVMSQELMARHVGMASGLVTGFAMGMGGVGALAIGALADRIGLDHAMLLIALLPVLVVAMAALVPARPRVARGAFPVGRPDPQATTAR